MVEKGNMIVEGHDMSLYEKNVTVDFYIVCNAAVKD